MSNQAYGIWAEAVAELMSYRYLGCRSSLRNGFVAEGAMSIRSDMRHAGGLLAAPVGIAMLDTAGIAVDRHWQLALTRAEVQLTPGAGAISRLGVLGSLTRQARTQVFTEANFVDADEPGRLVGVGTADWSIIAPTPTGFDYVDPGPGVPDTGQLPPLWTAYDAVPNGTNGFRINELTPRLGGVVLHHGPILVTLEAAAIAAAGEARVESLDLRIVRAGKAGPFATSAEVLCDESNCVLVRSEMHQSDSNKTLVATATVRLRRD